MTPFETIILIVLYLFAFVYTIHAMGIKDADDWVIRLIILISGAVGIFAFPVLFAVDIWEKLNKEEQQ